MSTVGSLFAAWLESEPLGNTQPEMSPSLSDTDEVLCAFLQDWAQLDQQPASPHKVADPATATTPNSSKRPAQDAAATPPKKSRKMRQYQPTKTEKPPVPTSRWQRRKQELETLRQQVAALDNYATQLKTYRVPGQLTRAPVDLPPELEELVQVQTGGWQAAAVREVHRCEASQQENRELKTRLQACVQVSGALQTTLNAAAALRREQLTRNSIASRALQVELMLEQQYRATDNALMFEMLEACVNARVGEIQSVVEKMSEPVTSANTETVCICRKDEHHAAVEFKTTRVLPFPVDAVSSVCWHVAELGWSKHWARVVRRSKDVVSSDWCFPVELESGETVDIRVRCVAKRFEVAKGFVVLAESTTEWPAHLAASGVWARVTRESGVGMAHPYPDSTKGAAASVSRFMMHLTSQPSGLDSETSRKLLGSPAVSDVVIPSFRKLIRNRQQCVDNRLMDAAFA